MKETDEKYREENANRKWTGEMKDGENTINAVILLRYRFAWWKHISDCQSFFMVIHKICASSQSSLQKFVTSLFHSVFTPIRGPSG